MRFESGKIRETEWRTPTLFFVGSKKFCAHPITRKTDDLIMSLSSILSIHDSIQNTIFSSKDARISNMELENKNIHSLPSLSLFLSFS